MTLQYKIKSYAPIMELTYQSMEKIKTLKEKLKTYTPLLKLTTKSMKKQRNAMIIPFNQHMKY